MSLVFRDQLDTVIGDLATRCALITQCPSELHKSFQLPASAHDQSLHRLLLSSSGSLTLVPGERPFPEVQLRGRPHTGQGRRVDPAVHVLSVLAAEEQSPAQLGTLELLLKTEHDWKQGWDRRRTGIKTYLTGSIPPRVRELGPFPTKTKHNCSPVFPYQASPSGFFDKEIHRCTIPTSTTKTTMGHLPWSGVFQIDF